MLNGEKYSLFLIKIMKRIQQAFFILLLAGIQLSSAAQNTSEKKYCNWQILEQTSLNQSLHERTLPKIHDKILNTSKFTSVKVTIVDIETTILSDIDKANYFLDNVSSEFNILTNFATERKKNYINYYIAPIRFNTVTQKFEQLVSYRIEITGESNNQKKAETKIYKSKSALSSGDWFKIKVSTSGVYKLTYGELLEIGITKPEHVRVYGYGGNQLPFMNDDFNHDDMGENAIVMNKGTDGLFNSGDYILFYSHGNYTWSYNETSDMFVHSIHNYSDYIYLFLSDSFGAGLRVEQAASSDSPNYTTNETDAYACYHVENYNFIESGRFWFSDIIRSGSFKEYDFSFENRVTNEPVKLHTYTAGRKDKNTPSLTLQIKENNTVLATTTTTGSYDQYRYAYDDDTYVNFTPSANSFTLKYNVTGGNTSSESLLGFICLNTRESLSFSNEQYSFRDKNSIGKEQTQFKINNNGNSITVWDITDPILPKAISINNGGNQTTFTTNTETLKEFIAFNESSYLTPTIAGDDLGAISNQNLHGVGQYDMVIVTHSDFINQANQIAEIRREEGLSIYITTPELIYNEFSSGTPDASAIRNFIRMMYDRSSTEDGLIKYLLLFGDGSYDNKTNNEANTNLIPTYQSENAVSETASFVTDDFYGLLDIDEGRHIGDLDIGIGRMPVKNTTEAQVIVDKIEHYESEKSKGSWRTNICFIADDEDGGLHMEQADNIAEDIIGQNNPEYNIDKIYLDAYNQESTPSGARYPDVTEVINNSVKKGALIIDYVGHGNPRLLTKEEVLSVSDVQKWKNYDKLAVFVTASCEVGRFDDYKRTSLGEWIVLNSDGGGVATLTTTRVVYASSNDILNQNFFKNALNPNLRLGDVIRIAKNNTGSSTSVNKRNFTLLGDPSLKLAIPENTAFVTHINDSLVDPIQKSVSDMNIGESGIKTVIAASIQTTDTVTALSTVKIQGYLVDKNDDLLDMNGVLYSTIYDKPRTTTTNGNDESSPLTFNLQNSVLYKGVASVNNGFFDFEFMMPKDIDYQFGAGKISLYGVLEDTIEAIGYSNEIIIGGISEIAEIDNDGPEIELFLNDTTFVNGGIANEEPILLAKLVDESGINTSGIGIGHDITAIIDSNRDNMIILNDFYQGVLNRYNCGEVRYPLDNLSPGAHTITLKAWDIYNNSSEAEIGFTVHENGDITINNMYNTPNPFYDETYFKFEHNQSSDDLTVTIRIYDTMGKLVNMIKQSDSNGSFNITPIHWDGTGNNGHKLEQGVYIYNTEILTVDGKKSSKSSKLMIFR